MKLSVLLLNSHGGIYQVNKRFWKACLIFDYYVPQKNHVSVTGVFLCPIYVWSIFEVELL